MSAYTTRRRCVARQNIEQKRNADSGQATRVRALQTAYRKAESASPRDDAPKAGAIRNLGLIDKEEDTKAVLGK